MKAGIYKIQDVESSSKVYIGSTKDLDKRKNQHFHLLRKGTHHSKYMQRYYNSYGEKSLSYEVVEECSVESLICREQYYIDSMKPCFNGRLTAEGNRGHVFSEEVRSNMSRAQKKIREGKDLHTILTIPVCEEIINLKMEGKRVKDISELTGIAIHNVTRVVNGRLRDYSNISDRHRKLNVEMVADIKNLLSRDTRIGDIAAKYNVKDSVISNIKSGNLWKNVESSKHEVDTLGIRPAFRISEDKVRLVKSRLSNYSGKLKDLAKELDVPYSKLMDIRRGRTHKNIN